MRALKKLWNRWKQLSKSSPKNIQEGGAALYLFDLDRTLLLSNSSYLFGRFLFQKQEITFLQLIPLLCIYSLYNGGIIRLKTLHHFCFSLLFRYKSERIIQAYAQEFVSKLLETEINPQMRSYLSDVMRGEAQGIILSASPYFLVEAIAKRLAMTRAYSTRYSVDESGEFLFVESVLVPRKKARLVEELREEFHKSCLHGFGDSAEDQHFLSLCDKATVVQPTPALASIAKKRGWPVL